MLPQRPFPLVLATSGWLATAGNLPLWRELASLGLLSSPAGWAFGVAFFLLLACLLVALLSLASWPRILKPTLIALALATAIGAYFMLAYHVVIDPGMAANVLQTDLQEARALFDPALAVWLAGLAGPPCWLAWRSPVRLAPWPRQALRNAGMAAAALLVTALVVLASFQPLASTMRNHKQVRYLLAPFNTLYALGHAAAAPWRTQRGALQPLGRDAVAPPGGDRPPLLVLVLGETGRSGNFGINGYARDTTPELARRGVASWRQAWSCGTSTAASVPCMFSHLGRAAFGDRQGEHENLLDVLQHAGLAVLWVDNQGGCKGVCDRVPSASTAASGEHDEVLLRGLDERIAQLPAQRRARGIVLVLHQMGSHGPAYAQRSPAAAKRFLPECETVRLQDCSAQELVNAYDNSIAYTDLVLARTIDWLRRHESRHDTAMLYVADHGESLGENNLYLHGLPYAIAPDVQKHVPWVTWLAPGFERRTGLRMECLRARAGVPVSHDHLFHAVLGLLQVGTRAYRRGLDPYADCTAP